MINAKVMIDIEHDDSIHSTERELIESEFEKIVEKSILRLEDNIKPKANEEDIALVKTSHEIDSI